MAKYQEWLKEDNLILLEGWARDGFTDEQISNKMGISYSTFREWKKKFPTFSAAIKRNKEIVDIIVENSLFKKACGYTTTIKKPIKTKSIVYDETTGKKCHEYEEIVYAEEEIHIPADTTAQIFWLKNRKPQDWRDKREVEQTEKYEDDGLLEALSSSVDEDMEDDSDFLTEESE